jgi:hypothetical protein
MEYIYGRNGIQFKIENLKFLRICMESGWRNWALSHTNLKYQMPLFLVYFTLLLKLFTFTNVEVRIHLKQF